VSAKEFARLSDGYELVEEIGGGGMATIYSARDLALGRTVAVKVLQGRLRRDSEAVERLLREARAVARLDHPNILSLFGVRLNDDGELCLIMPLVTGGTLRDELDRHGKLAPARVEEVLTQLLDALGHAHESGIFHRDIKPENVFVRQDDTRVLLADFGIARSVMDKGLTLTGTSLGTPNYMAPEQIDGADLDGRADLYSLGMLGYELLTGERPWQGETLYTVIRKQREEKLPPIQSVRSEVPAALAGVIERAIEKTRDERWPDAAAMRRALESPEKHETSPPPSTAAQRVFPSRPEGGTPSANSPTVRVQPNRASPPRSRRARTKKLSVPRNLGFLAAALSVGLGGLWVWGTSGSETTATSQFEAPEGLPRFIQTLARPLDAGYSAPSPLDFAVALGDLYDPDGHCQFRQIPEADHLLPGSNEWHAECDLGLVEDNLSRDQRVRLRIGGGRSMVYYVHATASYPNDIHESLSSFGPYSTVIRCREEYWLVGGEDIRRVELPGRQPIFVARTWSAGSGGQWGTVTAYLSESHIPAKTEFETTQCDHWPSL
jgi:serine/threonine protein kinase